MTVPQVKVQVEPVTFRHAEEIIRGSGKAEGYWVLADRRVFAMMAFLNAVGMDEEAPGYSMHPLRVKMREKVARNLSALPEKLQSWRDYYKAKGLYWGQYVNWALTLSADYPFRRIRPNEELAFPWTSYMLADMPEILNDFWQAARLDDVWRECWPDYAVEIKRYSVARMADEMDAIWQYMRMQRKDRFVIVHVPNPFERHNLASGARLEHYYFSVDGPGSNGGGLNVHEYLHTFINELVKADFASQEDKLRQYFEGGKDAPISASYPDPVLWTCECLVHAIDKRLGFLRSSDATIKGRLESAVDGLTRGGYTILGPLYHSLADYERSDMPFDRYFRILFERLPEYSR